METSCVIEGRACPMWQPHSAESLWTERVNAVTMRGAGLDPAGSCERVEAQPEGTTMARPEVDVRRADRDIRQAHSLISRLRGLSVEDSAAALHDHAVLTGVSVHTAALAVLAEWHPAGEPHRRVPGAHTSTTADRSGRLVMRWQGREKAHLSVRGVCSDDLAARVHRSVERALHGGATHLIIDLRGTTGADARLDDVLGWAGRRLWARRGVLIVRAPASEVAVPGLG